MARRWVGLTGVMLALLIVAPGWAVIGPGRGCAAADTLVRVGVVVDFGLLVGEQGAPGPRTACTAVADGINGFKVLEASKHTYTVDSSGLLCSIDGFPNDGQCGQRTAGGYRYWAYFHGSASGWSYSGVGPAGYHVRGPEVEGWHFVDGKGNPTDPPPSASPDPAATCPPDLPPTTVTPAPPPSTPNPPGPSTGPTTPPSVASPTTKFVDGRPEGSLTSTTVVPGAATSTAPATPGAPTTPATPGVDAGGDPVTSGSATVGTAVGISDGAGAPGSAAGENGGGTETAAGGVAIDPTPSGDHRSPSVPPGAALVVLAIVGLGVLAARRFRTSSDEG